MDRSLGKALGAWTAGVVLALVGLGPGPQAGAAPAARTTLERIDQAHRTGTIDAEQRLLYRFFRVVDRARIPRQLRADPAQERPLRCGSMILREVRDQRHTLSEAARRAVAEHLNRDPVPYADSYFSTHFELIVGSDGTPQGDIDLWLDVLEEVWAAEVTGAGFAPPPCTTQDLFPVYLANTGPDVYDLDDETYGYVDLDANNCPYMVVHPGYPTEPDPTAAIESTAAHEFQHGIQAAYDWWAQVFWMEATAVWAEELVYDQANGYLMYVNGADNWMTYPERSLTLDDGWHEYGSALWAFYLHENHGGTAAIIDIWERVAGASALRATDDYLRAAGGSLAEAYVDFTSRVATRDFEEGSSFDPVRLTRTHGTYPATGHVTDRTPASWGANYIEFLPTSQVSRLTVRFAGRPQQGGAPVQWGLNLVLFSGNTYTTRPLSVAPDGSASATVSGFGRDVTRVVLAVSVLDQPNAQITHTGVDYQYEATLKADGGTGCSCRTAGSLPSGALWLLALLVALAWHRRRRSTPHPPSAP